MKRLRKFLRLSASDRQLLIKTFILLGLVRLGLWLMPFKGLQKLLERLGRKGIAWQEITPIDLNRIMGAVNVSSRCMPGGVKCLARALTMQVLLRQWGASAQLYIGVAKGNQGEFEAHAWVEHQGQVVIGYLADLSRFTPLLAFELGKL